MTVKFTDKELEGVANGLEGVVAVATIKSEVDTREGGTLYYEGIAIEELAEKSSFEEVIFLLLYDRLPTTKEFALFKHRLYKEQKLSPSIKKEITSIAGNGHPTRMLPVLISHIALEDKNHSIEAPNSERIALRLIAQLPMIVAGIVRARQKKSFVEPKKELGIGANFMYQLTGTVPNEYHAKMMDHVFILHADHSLNASTFAARLCASTLSDMYMSIIAAVCTLTGPLHGGANEAVIKMLEELDATIKNDKDIEKETVKYVDNILKNNGKVMGIGHRVYHSGDPRARILDQYTAKICEHERCARYHKIAKIIHREMLKKKNLWPNVDFYSAIALDGIGIPHDVYTCIFAIARMAGWTAHVMEQHANNKLIRPSSKYVKSRQKIGQKYVPIEKRK